MSDTESASKSASQNPATFPQRDDSLAASFPQVGGDETTDPDFGGDEPDFDPPTAASSGDGTAYQEPAYKTAKQNPDLFGQGYVVNGQAFPDSTAAINHFRAASGPAATPAATGASLSMSQLGATQPVGGAATTPAYASSTVPLVGSPNTLSAAYASEARMFEAHADAAFAGGRYVEAVSNSQRASDAYRRAASLETARGDYAAARLHELSASLATSKATRSTVLDASTRSSPYRSPSATTYVPTSPVLSGAPGTAALMAQANITNAQARNHEAAGSRAAILGQDTLASVEYSQASSSYSRAAQLSSSAGDFSGATYATHAADINRSKSTQSSIKAMSPPSSPLRTMTTTLRTSPSYVSPSSYAAAAAAADLARAEANAAAVARAEANAAIARASLSPVAAAYLSPVVPTSPLAAARAAEAAAALSHSANVAAALAAQRAGAYPY